MTQPLLLNFMGKYLTTIYAATKPNKVLTKYHEFIMETEFNWWNALVYATTPYDIPNVSTECSKPFIESLNSLSSCIFAPRK